MNLLHIQVLLAHEPWVYTKGWIVTIAGFLIVIIALFILSFIFRGVAAYFTKKDEKNSEDRTQKSEVKKGNLHLLPLTSQLKTARSRTRSLPPSAWPCISLPIFTMKKAMSSPSREETLLGMIKTTELDTGNVNAKQS